jgi:hypothetical protein
LAAAAEPAPAVPVVVRRDDVEAWLAERRADYVAHGKRLRGQIPRMPPAKPAHEVERAELYLAKVEAEHEAATAWAASLAAVPEGWLDATRRAYDLVQAHVAAVAEQVIGAREALATVKAKRTAGQALARRNAEAARAKLLAAIQKEERRHAGVVELLSARARKAVTPASRAALLVDVEHEEQRHADVCAEFQRKADWIVSALATTTCDSH